MAQTVPPVEKLPLAARKNIRDEWESKVSDMTKEISDLLKEPYKIEVNFNQFYAYAVAAEADWCKSSPGAAAAAYLRGFIYNLKKFTEDGTYEEAINSFNELVTERKIAFDADSSFTYGGCSIKNGVFEINFNPKYPGTNTDYACSELPKEFDKALAEGVLPLMARRSIRDEFEAKEKQLISKIGEELLGAKVTLHADYDAIWKQMLAASKVRGSSIDLNYVSQGFGRIIYGYFDSLRGNFAYLFKQDDMMVEGYTDAITTGEIWIRVEPESTKIENYVDTIIDDGKLILVTIPSKFGINTSNAGSKIVDLL